MLIKKVKEINNFDAFNSFDWSGADLKKHNLIYGWNGSGKTTLSRIFSFLEKKVIFLPELESIDFSVATETGIIKKQDIAEQNMALKVFNEDFIKENLEFSESKVKKIVIVGKENIDIKKEIGELEAKLDLKQTEFAKLHEEYLSLAKFDSILTEAGSDVVMQFTNTPLANDVYYGRSYNKSKVLALINNGKVKEENLSSLMLKPEEIDCKRGIIKCEKSKIGPKIESRVQPSESNLYEKGKQKTKPALSELFLAANNLLDLSVKVKNINELEKDKLLRDWTESGYYLHKDRKSDLCEFCKNKIPEWRLEKLGSFFTDEMKGIKQQIDEATNKLQEASLKNSELDIEPNLLFPDLETIFIKEKRTIEENNQIISSSIDLLIKQLVKKKDYLFDESQKYNHVPYPKEAVDLVQEAIGKIKEVVMRHNDQVEKATVEIKKASEDIELHTIASNLTNKDYFAKKRKKENLEKQEAVLKSELDEMNNKLKAKRASLQHTGEAVEKINRILEDFFGKSYIYLEVAEPGKKEVGYLLKRLTIKSQHKF
jgi:wobble nucleotide-excising tRNase